MCTDDFKHTERCRTRKQLCLLLTPPQLSEDAVISSALCGTQLNTHITVLSSGCYCSVIVQQLICKENQLIWIKTCRKLTDRWLIGRLSSFKGGFNWNLCGAIKAGAQVSLHKQGVCRLCNDISKMIYLKWLEMQFKSLEIRFIGTSVTSCHCPLSAWATCVIVFVYILSVFNKLSRKFLKMCDVSQKECLYQNPSC